MDGCEYAEANQTLGRAPIGVMASLLVALLLFGGCEEGVDYFKGTDLPYTVWGFMNAGADTQLVRVFPIRDEISFGNTGSIDARVFSTNLTTGEQREWTYQRVEFDSLIEGHVFWSPFRAQHNHRYRLDVVRSDGETSSAEVVVPSKIDFEFDINTSSTIIPVRILGDVPNLIGLRVTYDAVNIPPSTAWPPGTPVAPPVHFPVTISYDKLVRQIDGGWAMEINLARDFAAIRIAYDVNCLITDYEGSAPDVWLDQMSFSALLGDSTWDAPDGEFNPNVLAVPGALSNVENGYGFFGAGMGIVEGWSPTYEVVRNAGFRAEPRCTGFARDVPECYNPPIPCVDERPPGIWAEWLN